MKKYLLRGGILLLVYTVLIAVHLENNTFYHVKAVKSYFSSPNDVLHINLAAKYNIPVNKYISKEQYFIIKDLPLVERNTKIETKPFEISRSFFITLFMMIAVTLIVINLNFNDCTNKKYLIGITFISLFIYHYHNVKKNELDISSLNERTIKVEGVNID